MNAFSDEETDKFEIKNLPKMTWLVLEVEKRQITFRTGFDTKSGGSSYHTTLPRLDFQLCSLAHRTEKKTSGQPLLICYWKKSPKF